MRPVDIMRNATSAISAASAGDAVMRSSSTVSSSSYQESVMKQKLKMVGLDISQANNNMGIVGAGIISLDQVVISPKYPKSPLVVQQQQQQAQASPRSAPIKYHEAVMLQRTRTARLDLNVLVAESPLSFPNSMSASVLAAKTRSAEGSGGTCSPKTPRTPKITKAPKQTPMKAFLGTATAAADASRTPSSACKVKTLSQVGSVEATWSPYRFSPRAPTTSSNTHTAQRLASISVKENNALVAKKSHAESNCSRVTSTSSCASGDPGTSFRSVALEKHQVSQYFSRCRKPSNNELEPILEAILEEDGSEESGDDSIFESENAFQELERLKSRDQ